MIRSIALALTICLSATSAWSQACQSLPPGPAKRQCIQQKHPGLVEAKYARCRGILVQRGSVGRGSRATDQMMECMRRKR